jgi:hypothetical protein
MRGNQKGLKLMSILHAVLNALWPWRRLRRPAKAARTKTVALEQLDHRQLLSVNFTGNVYNDFPATSSPGVAVVVNTTLPSSHPGQTIPSDIKPFIEHSGFDIDGFRLVYTPADDTLSVGIQQPINSTGPVPPGVNPDIAGNPVIAGDADDNGDAGTVNPNVSALRPTFTEFPTLGGSDRMGVFFDFNTPGVPDVVAGIPRLVELTGQTENKLFQVAQAVNFQGVSAPSFGKTLQDFSGYATLINTPTAGAFEFKIIHFSQLYQLETGKPFTADTTFSVGAFGGSDNDIGIGEAFFPAMPVTLGLGPIPPELCPPLSPPVLINPHSNFHVNTAHPTLVRVSVLGSSGFNVEQIVTDSVRLGGAAPIDHFFRDINGDGLLDETFIFRGNDIKLPPGVTDATITGDINNGQPANSNTFASTVKIFNRDSSFYTPAQLAGQQARMANGTTQRDAARLFAREQSRVPTIERNTTLPEVTVPPVIVEHPIPQPVNPGASTSATDAAIGELSQAHLARRSVVRKEEPRLSGPVVSIRRRA